MGNHFECPICHGFMVLDFFYERFVFDCHGERELDMDGIPIRAEYGAYTCDQCERYEERLHKLLSDDTGEGRIQDAYEGKKNE